MTGFNTYPTYPTGGPGRSHVRERDRTGTATSAVIGLGYLLATIGVIAFTSDDLPSSGTVLGAVPDGPTSSGGPVVVDASPIPLSELKRSFPLPPGAGPSHLDPGGLVDGTRAYDVRAPLNVVKEYYEQRLARIGYIYVPPSPTRTRAGGRIIGWAGSVAPNHGDDPDQVAFLTLNDDYFGGGPGVVTIQVRFT